MVGELRPARGVQVRQLVDVVDGDHRVVHGLHHEHRGCRHGAAEPDGLEDLLDLGHIEHIVKGRVHHLVHVRLEQPHDRLEGGHPLHALQHRAALVGRVFLHDAVQAGVGLGQRRHHQGRQPGVVRAVQPAEGVAQIAHRRAENGADDVEFGGVVGVDLSGPGAGQPAAGVPPQPDLAVGRQAETLEVQGGAQAVEHPVARLMRGSPHALEALVVGNRDHPALRHGGRHQQIFELGQRSHGPGPPAQGVGREAARGQGIDGALVGHHVAGLAPGVPSRHQHRRGARLRFAVPVGGAVEQLGGAHLLRDQPEESQLHVTRTQHRPGSGLLETRRGLVERILGRQHRAFAPPKLLVMCPADPLGAYRPLRARHCSISTLRRV